MQALLLHPKNYHKHKKLKQRLCIKFQKDVKFFLSIVIELFKNISYNYTNKFMLYENKKQVFLFYNSYVFDLSI